MKKLMLSLALLMGVSAASMEANANCGAGALNTFNEIIVTNAGGLKFKVLVKNDASYVAKVMIKNDKGEVFHEEYLKKNSMLKKTFDVSNLPDGNYQFEITVGEDKQIKKFQISSDFVRQVINE
jgi:hypothetical protein